MSYRKPFARTLFFLFLLACLLTGLAGTLRAPVNAAPIMAVSPGDVVISEFRFRGAGGGTDEFVEIYNRTGGTINLNGWKLKGSNASGATSTRFTINTDVLLVPGQYYLFANIATVDGVNADAVYATGITSDGGVAITLPNDTIVDEVGVSAGSAFKEGTNLASFPSDTDQSYERRLGGASGNCEDLGDNLTDFLPLAPSQPQNWLSPVVYCPGIETFTPTNTVDINLTNTAAAVNATGTAAVNFTGTAISNLTGTSFALTSAPAMGVVISEFRTRGPNGGNDEFIELYNTAGSPISIGGWTINKSSGCGVSVTKIADIPAGVTLASGQHYLIGGSSYSGSVTPDQSGPLIISDEGGIALIAETPNMDTIIMDQVGLCPDTLYHEGTPLAELTSDSNRSYERRSDVLGVCVDTNNNAADFILRSPSDPQNTSSLLTACGNPTPTPTITHTPTVTRTPTRTRTPTPVRTATRTPTPLPPPPPPPLIAINEFLPRPGSDWNNDGVVNQGDEFIELLNHGVIDVNLSGYRLDDEANIGSNPYSLPSVTLKPGERIVFYGSQTGLLLSDGGDGVRLLKPNGQLMDAYNYSVVEFPDQSFCRLPDNGGADDWHTNCFPTPGLRNSLSGSILRPPTLVTEDQPFCPIADTLPQAFVLAECMPFGNNIWNRDYWDRFGWYGGMPLPNAGGKWEVFAD